MPREKKEKVPNYTPEQEKALVEKYLAGRAEGKSNDVIVEALSAEFNKVKRSIVSKLARLEVYQKDEKAKAEPKDEGPSKKEMLKHLEDLGYNTEGLDGATKAAIANITALVQESQDSEAEAEDETEAA